jgi:uncharacterized alpha-E superfamily protein
MDLEADPVAASSDEWASLVRIASDFDAFTASYGLADRQGVGWYLTLSEENPEGTRLVVSRARDRARSVRDRLPSQVWEALNSLYLELGDWDSARLGREGLYVFCQLVREGIYLVLGLIDVGMRRDDHWTFLRLGRFLERSLLSSRMLAVRAKELRAEAPELVAPLELHRWGSVLQAAQADEAHAALVPGISADSVLRFLVLDDRFPRSVSFSLRVVSECLDSLVHDRSLVSGSRPQEVTAEARAFLRSAEAGLLIADPRYCLEKTQEFCLEIADAIHATCFAAGYLRHGGERGVQAQGQSQN